MAIEILYIASGCVENILLFLVGSGFPGSSVLGSAEPFNAPMFQSPEPSEAVRGRMCLKFAPARAQLAELGPVQHVVSPNFEHVKYAKQWKEADGVHWGPFGKRGKHAAVSKHVRCGAMLNGQHTRIEPDWFQTRHREDIILQPLLIYVVKIATA